MRGITAPPRFSPLSPMLVVLLAFAANAAAETPKPEPDEPNVEEDQSAPEEEPSKSRWDFKIGAGATYEPNYEGSEDLQLSSLPRPLGQVRWRTGNAWDTKFFLGTTSGLGVEILDTKDFSIGLKGDYGGARSEDADGRLKGLGNINSSVVGTLFGKLKFEHFAFSMEVTHYFAGSDGTLISLGPGTKVPVTERLEFGFGVSTTLGDGRYMGEFFSVTQQQAQRSGENLGEFDADAGFKDVTLRLQASYRILESWELSAGAGLGVLLGEAADSPVVEQEFQPNLGMGLTYKF